jgi:hypothetical protein
MAKQTFYIQTSTHETKVDVDVAVGHEAVLERSMNQAVLAAGGAVFHLERDGKSFYQVFNRLVPEKYAKNGWTVTLVARPVTSERWKAFYLGRAAIEEVAMEATHRAKTHRYGEVVRPVTRAVVKESTPDSIHFGMSSSRKSPRKSVPPAIDGDIEFMNAVNHALEDVREDLPF